MHNVIVMQLQLHYMYDNEMQYIYKILQHY